MRSEPGCLLAIMVVLIATAWAFPDARYLALVFLLFIGAELVRYYINSRRDKGK
jgi:predicted tellurium resistance membrane protein TerC